MANEQLFLELAKALSQPSKAYQAATSALDIPKQAIEGYKYGADFGDSLRKRKLEQQTLGEALQGQDLESGIRNFTAQQGDIQKQNVMSQILLKKAENTGLPKPGEMLLPDQARAYGVPEQLINSFKGQPIPRQVAQGRVTADIGQQRADASTSMASSRAAGTQNSILGTAMRYSQAGMAQKTAGDAFQRLGNLTRADQLVAQIKAQGGQATIRQRTELASAVGRSINPTGVLTNEALDLYIPQSLRGKVGNFQEYLSNQSVPVDFSGYIDELNGLIQREKDVNQGLIQTASQYGTPATEQLQSVNPALAQSVKKANQIPLTANQPGAQVDPSLHAIAKNAQGITIETNDGGRTWKPVTNGN